MSLSMPNDCDHNERVAVVSSRVIVNVFSEFQYDVKGGVYVIYTGVVRVIVGLLVATLTSFSPGSWSGEDQVWPMAFLY
jgi:hypothetical protein